MTTPADPCFACDAMLGSLARWLRAAGYDASGHPHIADWDLVRLARHENRILLSSDSGIFHIGIVRDGEVPALFVPPGLCRDAQLTLVFDHFSLPIRPPRCMRCGGELVPITKEQAAGRVPPRTWEWLNHFEECTRCSRLFWQGTHWHRIAQVLHRLAH